MAWAGSDRRERLPANWHQLRATVLKRDGYRCSHPLSDGTRCTERATDVDHIVPGDDHELDNLRALCPGHHRQKSGREGGAALAAKRRRNASKFKRVEKHPGLL